MTEEENLVPIKIGDVRDLESLKNVIVTLISKMDNVKYKTEIIKLCFILDYLYCKRFGTKEGPTTVEYIKYTYGPYSESFIEAFDSLIKDGILIEVSLPFGIGYALTKQEKKEVDEKINSISTEVVGEFGKKSLKDLKGFIYELEQFKRTEFGKPILLC